MRVVYRCLYYEVEYERGYLMRVGFLVTDREVDRLGCYWLLSVRRLGLLL